MPQDLNLLYERDNRKIFWKEEKTGGEIVN
jgi:hypothetical protein